VTSLQPAPMTRRARREAEEQQAQALRAHVLRAQGARDRRPQVQRPQVQPTPARASHPVATRSATSFDQVVTGAIARPATRPVRATSSVPAAQRMVSRAAVIGTLAAATIAAPFVQGTAAGAAGGTCRAATAAGRSSSAQPGPFQYIPFVSTSALKRTMYWQVR